MAAESASQRGIRTPGRWTRRVFRWHLLVFVALNTGLNVTNIWMGRPWWAFWPLIVTAMLLGLHYLLYKTMTVDERWAEERIEELNLKSYDRSHIEELKSRFGGASDDKR
jgi:hypothetical protein